jgi:2-oxoglutarate dehydrogenase E1 component
MLRRQAIRPLRKPLVVMSPKSLLRHKEAVSTLEDLANGRFHNVLDETDDLDKDKVERIILCAGKVFYDLRAARRERGVDNIAIIRLEQLYPFPEAELLNVLSGYRNIRQAVWCQEEPMNQGAWYSSQHHMRRVMFAHCAGGLSGLRRSRGIRRARGRLHGPAPGATGGIYQPGTHRGLSDTRRPGAADTARRENQ